ncbi:hypothetical protein GCM10010377_23730 [Streptomyces viridiviolaceus]|nr:hypothetical protein GCM10010377_23730 [Streptomyces viridiviolaceus]
MGGMRTTGSSRNGAARVLARLAVLAAIGAVVVLLLALGEGGLVVIGAGLLGLVVCAASGGSWRTAARCGCSVRSSRSRHPSPSACSWPMTGCG